MTDESYIKLTLEIAKKGKGLVSPNPMVGAVLVKDDKIIGAGYHKCYGGNHAEIEAINNSKQEVVGSTLYINLEPCSHYGKTPPCVLSIIEQKIKKVVIGTLDMNPLVSGKGIKQLKQAGVDVKVGFLEKECIELNKFFFKYITKKTPYVTLKIAQTLDGKIADLSGNSKWITSLPSRKMVHGLRSEYDAVLVGTNTVKLDDPDLTVRFVEGRNPKRIILDTGLKLSENFKLFNNVNDGNLYIVTSTESIGKKKKITKLINSGVRILYVKENKDKTLDLVELLKVLAENDIASVLVEGGRKIFTSFIKQDLYDDIYLFQSPKFIGNGYSVVDDIGVNSIKQAIKLKVNSAEKIGDDVLTILSK